MSIENVGPGSVSNSYGVRTTKSKLVYDNTDSYQDVFIPTGSVPVTAVPSDQGVVITGITASTAAPNDADGQPDGTIYIQVA